MPYKKLRIISGRGSGPGQFAEALRGLAVDTADRVYAVGDSKVAIFTAEGVFSRQWDTAQPGYCVTVGVDGTAYVGQKGQLQLFDPDGKSIATWRDEKRLGLVTAIGLSGDSVLVADVKGRCIRRYDRSGRFLNDIGKDNRMQGFVVPNGWLDLVVDRQSVIHAPNPGQHRVQRYSLDGQLLGQFGRFDGQDPAGFGGCCNPTNIALASRGEMVVSEKAGPRVKIYSPDGRLLELIGERDFDLACKNMDVAVDSRDRIYVIDTVRLQIVVYEPTVAASQPASGPAPAEATPGGIKRD